MCGMVGEGGEGEGERRGVGIGGGAGGGRGRDATVNVRTQEAKQVLATFTVEEQEGVEDDAEGDGSEAGEGGEEN